MLYFAIGVDNLYFLIMQFHKNKECMQLYFSSKSEVLSQFSSCIFPVENKQTNKQHHNKNLNSLFVLIRRLGVAVTE